MASSCRGLEDYSSDSSVDCVGPAQESSEGRKVFKSNGARSHLWDILAKKFGGFWSYHKTWLEARFKVVSYFLWQKNF